MLTACIMLERAYPHPPHPWADEHGQLEIYVVGHVGPIEAPSRHCPGDPGWVDLEPGPYEVASGPHKGKKTAVALTSDEEDDAEEKLREKATTDDFDPPDPGDRY